MSARTHFVYRVFDEYGLLLYVGCTKNAEKRLVQHRGQKSLWLQYMAGRVRMEGPFEQTAAFAREGEIIEEERPFFNALAEHRRVKGQRRTMQQRLLRDLRVRRPDLFGGDYDSERFAEFMVESQAVEEKVDAAIPDIDTPWRHANYLSHRRREAVKSA